VPTARSQYDIDSLTDVALRVFADLGFDGASMDDVAREAGITKAAIYHHVSGKEELLERGLDRALEALFAILDESEARDGPPAGRLRFIVKRVAELAIALRPEVTVLVRVGGSSRAARRAIARRRTFDANVAVIVRAAQAGGAVNPSLDGDLVVRLIFGLTNSLVEWYKPAGPLSTETIVATVVQIVFSGIDC